MADELCTDKVPTYVHNKHTTYENTVLQEHAAIVSNLKDTSTTDGLIESQGRLLIGMCLKNKTQDFINTNYKNYLDAEIANLKDSPLTDSEKNNAAVHRVWLRLITEAMNVFISKYKVDGARAKIAVIDTITTDGKPIAEVDRELDVCFTQDQEGV